MRSASCAGFETPSTRGSPSDRNSSTSRSRSAAARGARAGRIEWAQERLLCPSRQESPGNDSYRRAGEKQPDARDSAQPRGLDGLRDRTHDSLAMQKVVGSSPIIRALSLSLSLSLRLHSRLARFDQEALLKPLPL